MHRRDLLRTLGLATAGVAVGGIRAREVPPARHGAIQTVRGPIEPAELGLTLPHEHVLVDFVGADQVSPSRYDADVVFATALPHLREARRLGARGFVECTPAYLARDPRLLARLSAAADLHLLTNTGLYGARQNKFIPGYAHPASARSLADRWIREARDGIDDTGIRPGFIKSGIDPDPALSEFQRKLVIACAHTHLATGLTIAIHTGRGPGLEVLAVLSEHGVQPSAFAWVHAQSATDDALFAAADQGAWISLDGLNRSSLTRHLHLCRALKQRGHLGRILLSHDAGWFDPAKPAGGEFRGYELLFTSFLPLLREHGFTPADLDQLTIANPATAFTIRPRAI